MWKVLLNSTTEAKVLIQRKAFPELIPLYLLGIMAQRQIMCNGWKDYGSWQLLINIILLESCLVLSFLFPLLFLLFDHSPCHFEMEINQDGPRAPFETQEQLYLQ